MKKLFYLLIIVLTVSLLSGCPGNPGSSAPPPPWDTTSPPLHNGATPEDGRVKLEWNPTPGVDYWLFTATDPGLSSANWTGLANSHAYTNAAQPFYLCGLFNGTPYYFATNGRIHNGPGGASSTTISATPYNASAVPWAVNSTPLAEIVNINSVPTIVNPNIYGIGYTGLKTCGNNSSSATGVFAAVGAAGAIFTSPDGLSWANATPPPSFSTDLYAVTGYAAHQNNALDPSLRWVAVGADGASLYSIDGLGWTVGNPPNSYNATTNPVNPGNQALRSITHSGGTFLAVGDLGTILMSTDGITWKSYSSGLTASPLPALLGVTHGGIYVAVGEGGTILTSSDGKTWTARTPVPSNTNTLRQVTSYGSIYVAVGDLGTIVTSKDGGVTWITQTTALNGATPSLVGITAESQFVANPITDTSLGFISTAQFVAIDSAGNAYTSQNGYIWSSAIPTGTTGLHALVSSGFGYVAAGDAGTTAHAF